MLYAQLELNKEKLILNQETIQSKRKIMNEEDLKVKRDKDQFIECLLLDGEEGLIERTYVRALKTNLNLWVKIDACRAKSDLAGIINILKLNQISDNPNKEFNTFINLLELSPNNNETLIDYDLKIDNLYNDYIMSKENIKELILKYLKKVDESEIKNDNFIAKVTLSLLDRIISDKYRKSLKLSYSYHKGIQSFLEPYYKKKEDINAKSAPNTLEDIRSKLRTHISTYGELDNSKSVYSINAKNSDTNTSNNNNNTKVMSTFNIKHCAVCNKSNHNIHECRFLSSNTRDELAAKINNKNNKIINNNNFNNNNNNNNKTEKFSNKSNKYEKPANNNNNKNNYNNSKNKISNNKIDNRQSVKFNSARKSTYTKNKIENKIVSSTNCDEGPKSDIENDDDNGSVVHLYPVVSSTELLHHHDTVQLDNGANQHIINDGSMLNGQIYKLPSKLIIHTAGSNFNIEYGGDTIFGEALYSKTSRKILSYNILQQNGYQITPINKIIKGNQITTSYIIKKNNIGLQFHLDNGIYIAKLDNVVKFINHQKNNKAISISVATRNNPYDLPNNTDKSRTLEENMKLDHTNDILYEANENIVNNDVEMDIDNDLIEKNDISDQRTNMDTINDVGPTLETENFPSQQNPDVVNVEISNGELEEPSDENSNGPNFEARIQNLDPTANGDPRYVPSLGRNLTKQEEYKIGLVHKLHQALAHAGKLTEKKLVQEGHLLNSELTSRDVDIYYELFPTCEGCLKGKMRMPPQIAFTPPTGAPTGGYYEMDIGYFGDKIFLLIVEVISGYVKIFHLPNRKSILVDAAAKSFYKFHQTHFPKVNKIFIRCDREKVFEVFKNSIPDIEISRTSAEGHANRAEVCIKILKERARSILYSLGYNFPPSLYNYLLDYVTELKNYLPKTTNSETPQEIVTGRKIDLHQALKASFGQMGYAIIPIDRRGGKDKPTSTSGICIGWENCNHNNLRIYIPSTGNVVSRCKFIKSGIIRDIVIKLNNMNNQQYNITNETENINNNNNNIDNVEINSMEVNIEENIDNMTMNEAIYKFGHEVVNESVLKEINAMLNMNVFEFINYEGNGNHIPSKLFLKAKYSDNKFIKLKSRLVARGDLQNNETIYSPTVDRSVLNLILSLNKRYKSTIYSVDIPSAFLFANIDDENLFLSLPKNVTDILINNNKKYRKFINNKGVICVKLRKAIYGLKQSPRLWFEYLKKVFINLGYKITTLENCLYFKNYKTNQTFIIFHVDDIIISTNNESEIKLIKEHLKNTFGDLTWYEKEFNFLGMHLHQQPDHSIIVDMTAFTLKLLSKYDHIINNKTSKNPSSLNLFKDIDNNDNNIIEVKDNIKFKSIIMEMMYLTHVRVDILKEVILLASYAHKPSIKIWEGVYNILYYLNSNRGYCIRLTCENDDTFINLYADASYACHPDSRSHSGIITMLGSNGGIIQVKSKKQNIVTLSSTEAELYALVEGIKLCYYLAVILLETGVNDKLNIICHQDNLAAKLIAENGVIRKSRSFRIRTDYLTELIQEKIVLLKYCPTDRMRSDYLTKHITSIKLLKDCISNMFQNNTKDFYKMNELTELRVKQNK